MEIAWLGLTAIASIALVRSTRFRHGVDRSYLGLYRNTDLPAVYRHLPLVAPFASAYALALLLVAGVRSLLGPDVPGSLRDVLFVSLLALCVLLLFATSVLRAVLPPAWLTPPWLAEDDVTVGYKRPKLGWTDRGWVAMAIAVLLGALVLLAYVAFVVLRHSID